MIPPVWLCFLLALSLPDFVEVSDPAICDTCINQLATSSQVPVLRSVNISMNPGEVVAIVSILSDVFVFCTIKTLFTNTDVLRYD